VSARITLDARQLERIANALSEISEISRKYKIYIATDLGVAITVDDQPTLNIEWDPDNGYGNYVISESIGG
jgi:uncharacterized protein YmfQ (DUF2313 family)